LWFGEGEIFNLKGTKTMAILLKMCSPELGKKAYKNLKKKNKGYLNVYI